MVRFSFWKDESRKMWENQLGGYFSSLNEEQQKQGEKSTLELGAEFGHVKDEREGITNISELPAL